MQTGLVVSVLVAAAALGALPALGQSQVLTIDGLEDAYEGGDVIVISGKVTAKISDSDVALRIFHGTNLVEIRQIKIAQDGSYSTEINTAGPNWAGDGKYIISITYARDALETSFTFTAKKDLFEEGIFEVDAGGRGTFDVGYTIDGGILKGMAVDYERLTLVADVSSEEGGSITVSLPREAMDAKGTGGADVGYIVTVNDAQVAHTQASQDAQQRTLEIAFGQGDSVIRIIGTFIIPEFGAIAALVLAATTILAIALSRGRLQMARSF